MSNYFETEKRDDGEPYVTLTDDRPEWLYDAVREAHDDELPNDWRYETCAAIVEALDQGDDPSDIADSLTDVYTFDLLSWLSANISRTSYVNEARDEGLIDSTADIDRQIAIGQYVAIERMAHILAQAISDSETDEYEEEDES